MSALGRLPSSSRRRLAGLALAALVPGAAASGVAGCSGDATTPTGSPRPRTTDGDPATDGGATGDAGGSGSSGGSSSGGSSSGGSSSGGSSSGGAGPGLAPGKSTRSVTAAGRQRSFILVVPSQVTSGPVPLVIALHGNGDTSAGFITQTTALEQLAGQKGFVLAAPQGISQTLTIGQQTIEVDWDAYRSTGNIDLPLVDAVRAELVATGAVDPKRLTVLGYSQGGYLAFRYGMDNAAALACTAVLAAANPLGTQLTAGAARKIPVALQIGTSDFGIGQARATRDDLQQKQFPLDYREIAGAGHVPVPGDLGVPLGYCLGRALP